MILNYYYLSGLNSVTLVCFHGLESNRGQMASPYLVLGDLAAESPPQPLMAHRTLCSNCLFTCELNLCTIL